MVSTTASPLDLETLTTQYNLLLTKYEQAQTDYINYLQTKATVNNITNDALFGIIPNTQFISKTRLKTTTTATDDLCKSNCAQEDTCSGATFSSDTGQCVMRSGEGRVSRNSNTSSIVPKELIYLSILKKYNEELNKINQILLEIASVQETSLKTRLSDTTTGSEDLSEMYNRLLRERSKIDNSIAHISMSEINQDERTSTDKVVTARHIWYIFVCSVVMILVIIIIKLYAPTIKQAYSNASYMAAHAFD
jgi:hypothetical protein